MASILAIGHRVGMGAEIPGLIGINSHGKLPVSGATDCQGNPAAREIPRVNSPGSWEFPGEYPGGCISRPIPREHGCGVRLPGQFPGESRIRGILGKFGRGGRIPLFSAIPALRGFAS